MKEALALLALVGLAVAIHYVKKGIGHGVSHAIYHNTNARALEEVWTVLTFEAPGSPADVQASVVSTLALPATPPTAFVARSFLEADRPGTVQVSFGNKMQSQFTAVGTFTAAASGGTSGRWEVARWTTHDGVINSPAVTQAMVTLRGAVARGVEALGGTAVVRVVPQAERTRR